jgi:hypothetical protein
MAPSGLNRNTSNAMLHPARNELQGQRLWAHCRRLLLLRDPAIERPQHLAAGAVLRLERGNKPAAQGLGVQLPGFR